MGKNSQAKKFNTYHEIEHTGNALHEAEYVWKASWMKSADKEYEVLKCYLS